MQEINTPLTCIISKTLAK